MYNSHKFCKRSVNHLDPLYNMHIQLVSRKFIHTWCLEVDKESIFLHKQLHCFYYLVYRPMDETGSNISW